jgi:hypothetical protein
MNYIAQNIFEKLIVAQLLKQFSAAFIHLSACFISKTPLIDSVYITPNDDG